ncbi:MAG: hypothetical protein K8R40_05095, partial [Anaerolineaceae bacterium]|nr:hypothetical protein [Anaerolineaceae bacterium]
RINILKLIDRLMYLLPAILLGIVWIIGFYYYFEFPDVFETRATYFYILNVPIVIWCVVRYGHKSWQE